MMLNPMPNGSRLAFKMQGRIGPGCMCVLVQKWFPFLAWCQLNRKPPTGGYFQGFHQRLHSGFPRGKDTSVACLNGNGMNSGGLNVDANIGSSAPSTKLRCTVSILLPQQAAHLRLWWEQGFREAVEVAKVELDAGVGDSQLVNVCGAVPGADVTLA